MLSVRHAVTSLLSGPVAWRRTPGGGPAGRPGESRAYAPRVSGSTRRGGPRGPGARPGRAIEAAVARAVARAAGCLAAASLLAGLAGCIPPAPTGFDSPDPTERLVAISEAGDSRDGDAVPELIEQLESNDPAARMLAIRSLERITDQTLGYDYADPWWERSRAVSRWRAWARESGVVAADPSAD